MNTEKIVEYVVSWLKSYATNSKVNGFVVGVSGGIDSAVTSTLCAETGFPVLCVEMPIHQGKNQVTRAKEHISQLKERFEQVSSIEVNLTNTFENFKNEVLPNEESNSTIISLANTRARLRMTTLYYFAGIHGYLVTGTGNKIEDFGIGFFTKYGDGGVDLSPIADLMKSEVYLLAKALKVPNSIMNANPTDGLFGDSRSDEDQIGASYDELEWAMKQAKQGKSIADFEGRKKTVFDIYMQRNKANKHKMIPIPVCEIPTALKL